MHTVTTNQIYPYQPYLEYNNNYQHLIPTMKDCLNDIIWEVYQVDDFDSSKSIALPDLCADIMTFYTAHGAKCYLMESAITLQQMKELELFNNVKSIFGVRIKTGKMGNLFRCATQDVGNTQIDIRDAFYNGAEIEEKMSYASTFSDRYNIIANYIKDRIKLSYDTNNIVLFVFNKILETNGNISISELEQSTGYSGRHLRNVIKGELGISIKQLCEVMQFQWMCNYYKQNDGQVSLPDLAALCGYYDQSHMNKCCKKLTGTLPKEILNLYAGTPQTK